MSALDVARQFLAMGVDAFPCHPGDKHPYLRWQEDWEKRGKHPTDQNLVGWFATGRKDVFVRCCTKYVVVDCDNEAAHDYWAERLGTLAGTTTAVKTSRGYHFAFAVPDGTVIPNWGRHDGQLSFDIRGSTRNSGVVVPPAADGRDWIRGLDHLVTLDAESALLLLKDKPLLRVARSPADFGIEDTPPDLVLKREADSVRRTPPGGRNDQLNKSAYTLGRLAGAGRLAEADIRCALTEAADDAGMDERTDGVSGTITSGLDAGRLKPQKATTSMTLPGTDLGNAERLTASHGDRVRHVKAWNRWLVYDGRRWTMDTTGEVERLMKLTVRSIYDEAKHEEDTDRRQKLARWATASESAAKIAAALLLARSELPIAASADQFDADPMLLSVGNGTLDLRTGILRDDDPRDLITTGTNIDYNPAAGCPQWLDFIRTVTCGDEELAGFLQRAVGYTLTGSVAEQALFFLHGIGANGKTTLERVLQELLGGYAVTADPELLLAKDGRNNSHPASAAAMRGKRLAICSEIAEGKRFAEVTVKQLTGGDTVAARFMHQDWFNFEPTHKFWIAANHRPGIRGTDDGIWRRIKLIAFHAQIPPENRVSDYHRVLLDEEGPGILRWAVDGALQWQRLGGLGNPPAVAEATYNYRQDEDRLGMFIEEYLVWDPDGFVSTAALSDAYERWAKQENVPRLETKVLRTALIERADSDGRELKSDKKREGHGRASSAKRGLSGVRLRDGLGWL